MTDVTVSIPAVGLKSHFSFKEPFSSYVKSQLNTSDSLVSLTVSGVSEMEEMLAVTGTDPYQSVYAPVGISEYDYRADFIEGIPVLTLKHVSSVNEIKYIRVPLNYILSHSDVQDIAYHDKVIIIGLGSLPVDLDTSVVFDQIQDTIHQQLGLTSEIKEVTTGQAVMVTSEQHQLRTTVIKNRKTVFKTPYTRLSELEYAHTQLLNRLQTLNISLS